MTSKLKMMIASLLSMAGCAGCGGALANEGKEVMREAAREAIYVTMCEVAAENQGAPEGSAYDMCLEMYEKGVLTTPPKQPEVKENVVIPGNPPVYTPMEPHGGTTSI